MANLIDPRTPSGFRDYPPALMIPRERVLATARDVYRSYGYAPIDTPAVEYLDVLLGKGGDESDKLVYRVKSAKGDKDELGLRFDLTVPFARFSAKHVNESGLPFKRYAMGPVWRGERPGQGRYREFWQCDFDIIGTTSTAADLEIVLIINSLFEALAFTNFKIRINHRQVLNGALTSLGFADKGDDILRVIDKLSKIGREGVRAELQIAPKLKADQADRIMEFIDHCNDPDSLQLLAFLETTYGANVAAGVQGLREIVQAAATAGVPPGRIQVDVSIARGLEYYTGTVFETFLDDLPAIGSVCSGGRYDNLASLYTKQVLPGVGASLGVDRLIAAMEELKHPWMTGSATAAPVLILNLDAKWVGDYQKLGRALRAAGIGAEVYPDAKKLGAQFQYAEKRGFQIAVIAGEAEFAAGTVKVKHLAQRAEQTIPQSDLLAEILRLIAPKT